MPSAWLIRAGEDSRLAAVFESSGKVAVGWPDVPGLDDLTGVTKSDVVAALKARGSSPSVAALDAKELISFRDDLAVGDIVVSPDSQARQVLVGEIDGAYEFSEASVGEYGHTRTVTWLGRADRDVLDDALRRDTNFRRTLKPLTDNGEAWSAVADQLRSGASLASPKRVTHRRGRSEAIEAERVASERKCSGCGYMKRATQFDDSDLCVDCR